MRVYFRKQEKTNLYLIVFFRIIHVVFGFDFGFFAYKTQKIKLLVKSLCLIQSLVWTLVSAWGIYKQYNISVRIAWLYAVYSLYVTYVVVFLIKKSDVTLNQFNFEIQYIDLKLRDHKAHKFIEKKLAFFLSLSFIYKILFNVIYCCVTGNCFKPHWIFIICIGITLACDTVLILNIYIVYACYYRMKMFTFSLLSADNELLLSYLYLYESFADIVEKYKAALDVVFLVSMAYNIPLVMVAIYYSIWYMKMYNIQMWQLILYPEFMSVCLVFALAFWPAVVAGQLGNEVFNIKIVLHQKLMYETRSSRCREIKTFIRYVEARPLRFRVYKVIPFDASLVGIILSFCLTYIVVAVQFTHLY